MPALPAPSGTASRARGRASTAGIALAIALLVAPVDASAGGEGRSGPAASDFAGFVNAWQGRNAAAIRRLIPEKERVTIDLEGWGDGRITGRPTAENAEAVLKEYFAKIEAPALKDVSPEDSRAETRSFDYTYRPTGAETRTTTLSVTLKASGGGYVLKAILERVRKP